MSPEKVIEGQQAIINGLNAMLLRERRRNKAMANTIRRASNLVTDMKSQANLLPTSMRELVVDLSHLFRSILDQEI